MKKSNKFNIGIIIACIMLLLGTFIFNKPVQAEEEGKYSISEIKNILSLIPFFGEMIVKTNESVNSDSKFGAVSGPDVYSPYMSFNGVTTWYNKISPFTSTTTICAIKSPTSATSTLIYASVNLTTSSTTASIIDMAKATTAFATTTKIGSTLSVGAGAQVTMIASTTPTGKNLIFAPGQWFVVKMVAGPGKTVSPAGKCIAEFRQVD